jgi:hypothetical protein
MRQLLGTTRKSQANDVSTEESYVRFGSLADVSERTRDVRFTPESGHAERQHRRPLRRPSVLAIIAMAVDIPSADRSRRHK